jgi:ribonuclease T1
VVVSALVLVLVLVVVLVALVGPGGSDGQAGTDVVPTASGTSTSSTTARPGSRPVPASPTRRSSSAATPDAGVRDPETGLRVVALARLPREAQTTVALIDRGGPFPYSQDGVTFGNRERLLPAHPSGWYREYTVRTPGEGDRGPRRIVTGDDDRLIFYTGDHYASFVRVTR